MGQIVSRRVVSLADSARRDLFLAQPAAAGFEVWEAFDGRTGAGRDQFDAPAYKARTGKDILPGEIGCVLSHLYLLQHFAGQPGEPDDLLLVAEDDAVLSGEAGDVTRRVAHRGGFGWALLANPFEQAGHSSFWSRNRDRVALSLTAAWVGPVAAPWRYRLGRYAGDLWGTGLYLVTRQSARALVDYAERVRVSWTADDYVTWHQRAGVDVHMLRPNVAGWRGASDIHPTDRAHLNENDYSASAWGRQAWLRRYRRGRMAMTATRIRRAFSR